MSLIENQWITNDYWISHDIIFVVSCAFGVMLCYGDQIINVQVVTDMNYP